VIMLTAIAVKLAHIGLDRFVFGRLQAWRRR
jgi:iron(III) transport system permease protein